MKLFINEFDLDNLHRLARGMAYGEIAVLEGVRTQTIKNRMAPIVQAFGAKSIPNLVAILIASGVLYLPDLYQEVDICIRKYQRKGGDPSRLPIYRLHAVREL